jgi:uncharacterized RmlC-like cupin family protein
VSVESNLVQDHRQQAPAYHPLRVVNPQHLMPAEKIAGLREAEVIGQSTLGAEHLGVAQIVVAPGLGVSPVHHHGEGEGVFYVLHGRLTFFFGQGLCQRVDVYPGDFVFIPSWTIHAEANLGDESAAIIGIRSRPEPSMFIVPEAQVPAELVHADARI